MAGMDAKTARTENIRRLVTEAGGPTRWAAAYGEGRWSQVQVSQWTSPTRPKAIGHELARDIEGAMGLSQGQLDRPSGEVERASHSTRPDLTTIYQAMDFLDEMFEARGKQYDRHRYPLLTAAVVEDLCLPEPLSVVQLSVKYGRTVDAGRDWESDKVASAG